MFEYLINALKLKGIQFLIIIYILFALLKKNTYENSGSEKAYFVFLSLKETVVMQALGER